MKKGFSLFLVICITLGLIGCDQTSPKNTESSEKQTDDEIQTDVENLPKLVNLTNRERQVLELVNYEIVKPALTVTKFQYEIEIPENAEVYAYTFAEEKIYYAVGYANYFYSYLQEGKEPPAFEDKHNTQIRSYDIATGQDVLIYGYDKNYVVEVYGVFYQDGCLVWDEEGTAEYDWKACARKLNLKTGEMSYVLYDEMVDNGPKNENLPYIVGGVDTQYRHGNGWTKITISGEYGVTELSVNGYVTYAASNGKICLWDVPAREGNIHIYDMVNDQYYRLETTYFSDGKCTIYKNWLLINLEDGLYACNIPEGFCAKIDEKDSGYFYNEEDGVYSVLFEKIIYIQ